MAPSAVTPPPIVEKKMPARPQLARSSTANMGTKRKIICFSDFDGTIFMQDTGHQLFDNFGCGPDRRAMLAKQMEEGERTFREVSDELYSSLNVPFDDGFEVMEDSLEIDRDFRSFHTFCLANEIPFNVISAGLKPVLRKVLDTFLGEEQSKHIDIVANDADINPDGSEWKVIWRHDSELGHDKALSIQEARAAAEAELAGEDGTVPLIVFIGDGVSDLPGAREADCLFARRGLRLEEYCLENNISYTPFDTFADIQRALEEIMAEDAQKTGGKGMPARFNPRANMWRRVSSKNAVPRYIVMSPTREERMFLWPEAFTELKTPGIETTLELGGVLEEGEEEQQKEEREGLGNNAPAVVVPAA